MEETAKRTRRTPQQKADEMEAKIQKLQQSLEALEERRAAASEEFDQREAAIKSRIAELEKKKKSVFAPKTRKPRRTKKQKIQDLIKSASKSGLKPEEIAPRLGLEE